MLSHSVDEKSDAFISVYSKSALGRSPRELWPTVPDSMLARHLEAHYRFIHWIWRVRETACGYLIDVSAKRRSAEAATQATALTLFQKVHRGR